MITSHPCSQPQDELGSLLETHELRNSLCHHGDKLLHFPIQLHFFLPYDLPYVRVRQLQRGGHQAKGSQGKDTCSEQEIKVRKFCENVKTQQHVVFVYNLAVSCWKGIIAPLLNHFSHCLVSVIFWLSNCSKYMSVGVSYVYMSTFTHVVLACMLYWLISTLSFYVCFTLCFCFSAV